MHDISKKTFGFLVDELITAWMKVSAGDEFAIERRDVLVDFLKSNYSDAMSNRAVDKIISELKQVSWRCFKAQDMITNPKLSDEMVAMNAREAQAMNAKRNKLIRALDQAVGEGEATVLGKTYG